MKRIYNMTLKHINEDFTVNITRREFTKIGCRIVIGASAGTAIIESIVKSGAASESSPKGEYD